jgi:hypothetical protein
MSETKSTASYIFHTDLGVMQASEETVSGYDIEDVVQDRAFSQAQDLRFQSIANRVDVNAPIASRTIISKYLQEA